MNYKGYTILAKFEKTEYWSINSSGEAITLEDESGDDDVPSGYCALDSESPFLEEIFEAETLKGIKKQIDRSSEL